MTDEFYFFLKVSRVRFLSREVTKVKNISAEAVSSVFEVRSVQAIQEEDEDESEAVLQKVYSPKNITVDLKYIDEKIKNGNEQIANFIFSLALFTLDKLKEKLIDDVEISSNNLFHLFTLSMLRCENKPIKVQLEKVNDFKNKLENSYVISKKKMENNKVQIQKVTLNQFLMAILSDFENAILGFKLSESKREELKVIVLHAIGVFTLSYIVRFIDFYNLERDHFAKNMMEIRMKKVGVTCELTILGKNFKTIEHDETFLQNLYDWVLSGDKFFYLGQKGELILDKPSSKKLILCNGYSANTEDDFLFIASGFLNPKKIHDSFFSIYVPASIKHLVNFFRYLTGGKLKIDDLYKIAYSALFFYYKNKSYV